MHSMILFYFPYFFLWSLEFSTVPFLWIRQQSLISIPYRKPRLRKVHCKLLSWLACHHPSHQLVSFPPYPSPCVFFLLHCTMAAIKNTNTFCDSDLLYSMIIFQLSSWQILKNISNYINSVKKVPGIGQ